MKVYVLQILDTDVDEIYVYDTFEKAVYAVIDDLYDVYHFDTEEPLISEELLHHKENDARTSLTDMGQWKDDDTHYYIIERDVE